MAERKKFFEVSGLPRNRFFSCAERKDKVRKCRELGITHFVDNRLEVLSHMVGLVPHLYLFQPAADEIERFPDALSEVNRVTNWSNLVRKIRQTL